MGKGEFERIAAYFAPLASGYPNAYGLLDDAAVITPGAGEGFVVTTDTIVEGIHFLGREPADMIARKLLRVSLSDLAAMGARPEAYTLNVALPRSVSDDWLAAFAAGLRADQEAFGIHLVGGDSVATEGVKTLTATLFGTADPAAVLRRSGAGPDQSIYVSGTIGDGALGLRVAQGRLELPDAAAAAALVDRYHLPRPRTALGLGLRGLATAATDISDGLLADLGHIVDVSGVGAVIELARVPLSPGARLAVERDAALMETAVTGGDDYELVFTGADDAAVARLAAELEVPLTRIGATTAAPGVRVLDADGGSVAYAAAGFRHA